MKLLLISTHFGDFSSCFQYFLKSCENNPSIDWLIYSDRIVNEKLPPNVKLSYITFEDMQKKIQAKFDFPIAVHSPHKICDFKPAFGYIFEEDIQKYEHWGHCDTDVIWGDMEKFLKNQIFQYEKVYTYGHLTIYRNQLSVNRRFMYEPQNSPFNYRMIFSKPQTFFFDEQNNVFDIHKIYLKLGIPFYESMNHMVDLDSRFFLFRSYVSGYETIYLFFIVLNRNLYAVYQRGQRYIWKEIAYVHFMGRTLTADNEESTKNVMLITPYSMSSYQKIKNETIESLIKDMKNVMKEGWQREVDLTKTQPQLARETFRFLNHLLN